MKPKIIDYKWGAINVDGNIYKDCIITPEGSFEWDMKNFGSPKNELITSHQHKKNYKKGIQIHSVRDLLNFGDVFILSTGMDDCLGVNSSTIDYLKFNGKKVIDTDTKEAIACYNELRTKHKVVAVIHTTC